ncbi:hypothetical protein [Mycobacteroides abscessus]|uniref:hypothetical protein n=1 Tax=Mycobacteroides abscessus TaxID=36809 RepID=UPI0007F9453E|nr:hypothetical protein [Mycobacteroides abscessus]ANN98208.1 hypothetical protein BAB74_05225 [Mycobacteroides abscessus]
MATVTSEVPDWALEIPSAPVHQKRSDELTRPFTPQQLQEFGKQFIEQFLGRVVLAVVGHLIPGVGSFDQLREWAADKPGLGDLVELLTGVEDGDLTDLGTWALGIRNALAGIDLAHPESILTAIAKVAGQFFKGVIPAAWIADVAQDLTSGAGGFTDPSVVEDNPDWHYDATQNGHLSGKSIYVNADGHLYTISVKDAFEVAAGQIVDVAASAMWRGLTAAGGSNPIRLCITPFGPDRTKLPDVTVKQIQPMAADSAWVRTSLTGSWTVPNDGSIKWATVTLVVTAGATGGRVHFSNVTSAMSNLGPVLGKFRSFFDTIGGQANSDIAQFEQRFAAITADGKIDASEILGLLGLGNIPTLPQFKVQDLQTTFNQLGDIYNGLVVTPINGFVGAIANWFGANKNKTQKLTPGGTMSVDDVTGDFGMSRVADLVDNLGDMLTGVKTGADGTATGTTGTIADQINQAKDSLLSLLGLSRDALKSAIAAQTTLQEQETEQNTGGGSSYSFTFSGADGAALNGADWTTGPNPGDITIRGDSGYAGVKNGNPDGYFFASPNYTYATDGQSASFVLGDNQNGNYYSGVYIRCDAGRTQGAYCLAREGEIRIGKFTRSGSNWSFNSPLTLQTGLSAVKQGARIEIRCSGTNYFVRVNGRQILSATDAGNTINIGAAYRYSMFSVQRASPFFTYDSYRIAAFAMSDYTSAGAGFSMSNSWSIRRDSTADVAYGPYSSGAFPSGFFTFNDYTTDVTLDDLGTARIEIATTGLYRINTTYRSVTAKGTSVPYWALYKNGSRITGAIASGCPFEIPLVAGDVVQPGFIAVDYDIRSNGSTGSETVVSRSITALSGVATFDGRRIA